jgi:hypothetical protein
MKERIEVNVKCPTCDSVVNIREHKGMLINYILSLSAQAISLVEQSARLQKKQPTSTMSQSEIDARKNELQMQHDEIKKLLNVLIPLREELEKQC